MTLPARDQQAAWSHRPGLDGVRAIAVYLVVLFHCGLPGLAGGFIGVDIFFVLSGFLITNVLLNDMDRCGRVRFGRFYARRVRRLLPAAVVVVAATSLAFLLTASVVERLPLVGDAQSALLYVANWRFLHEQNDYFATGFAKSPFLHFWSLSIEEQFYVVYPIVLVGLTRLGRRLRAAPAIGLAVLFAMSLSAQFGWAAIDPGHAYYGTDARSYQLLAGALLAWWLRGARPPVSLASAASVAGVVGVVLVGSSALSIGVTARGVAAVAVAVLLVGGLAVSDRGVVHEALSRPAVAHLGRVSYATYLWHWPVILVVAHLVRLPSVAVALIAAPVSTGIATASYRMLEMPIRRARLAPRLQWVTVSVGVSVCGLVAVLVVPPVLNSPRQPAIETAAAPDRPTLPAQLRPLADRRVTHSRVRVPVWNWSSLATDFGPERTCDASDPQRCIVVHGHGLHLLLVGDSHGRMLAPALIALAHDHGFTLSLNVLPSCPWQAQLSNLSQSPQSQARCTAARDVWYRTVLPRLHPDVVVLADYARDDPSVYANALKRTGGSHETLQQLVLDTTNETLARITATGARALILKDTITASFDPLDCLSRSTYVEQCLVQVPRPPISDSYYAAAARHSRAVFTFNINRILCPSRPLCSPVLDGINVWRNNNHYSTRILVHVRDQIWTAIRLSGALSRFAPVS